MANVLHIAGWFDPSGDVTRSVHELQKYSDHKHEVIVKWTHPSTMDFAVPVLQNPAPSIVNEKVEWADAIVYHLVGRKHQLGYHIETNKPQAFRNANVQFAVDTNDFYCLPMCYVNHLDPHYRVYGSCHAAARRFMGDDAHFLPALMPICDEMYTPDWSDREKPRVAYIKQHAELEYLLRGDTQFKCLNLFGMRHADLMHKRKGLASVAVDNLYEGHYGLAGTEALSQGIPAVAWNHPITLRQLKDMSDGHGSPFLEATSLADAVEKVRQYLRLSVSSQNVIRQLSRSWIEKYYNSKRLIERYWEPFFDKLVRS